MVEFYKTLPIEQRAEGLQLLIEWMIQEKEERENCWSQGWRKTKGSTKKKSETSETTTHTTHTTSEVKEKNEFEKTLDEFIKMRKAIKKPITEEWIKLVKQKLEKMYPGNQDLQIQVLQNSISNSRQWVFPLKEGKDKIDQNSELVKKYKEQARKIREQSILDEINKYKNEKSETWTFDRRSEISC
jgi:hypothetical protein